MPLNSVIINTTETYKENHLTFFELNVKCTNQKFFNTLYAAVRKISDDYLQNKNSIEEDK